MTMADSDFPVFVVGAPRSGTTLVYSLLVASGEFVEYEEGETRLLQCRDVYGPLDDDRCFRRFTDDWMRSQQFGRSGLSESAFLEDLVRLRGESYVEVLRTFMTRMAEAQGKPRWAEKTPANLHHMRELAEAFPEARFVHVIRDGRDVALSRRKLGWHVVGSSDPVRQLIGASRHWTQLVRTGQRTGATLEERYTEVHYEDLIADPQAEGGRLAQFVKARLSRGWGEDSTVGALGSGYSAFSDDISGISSAPVGRWRESMTEEEIAAVVASVGPTLRQLGYEVDMDSVPRNTRILATAYGIWVDLALGARRFAKEYTRLRQLRAPKLLDFDESDTGSGSDESV